MSQVELLIPRSSLPSYEPRSSPNRDSYVDINVVPPSDEVRNNSDKHVVDNNSADVVECQQDFQAEERDNLPQNRKKKHRRGKKRKWRPYCKLNWEERRELQDREAKRAEKVRADMCACGMTLAPYNTTQFLMEDHNLQEPDYEHIPVGQHRHRVNSHSNDSSDEFYSSPEDEEDFLQQQFTETYKSIHAERLSNMSKNELVQELMTMEDRLENVHKRLDSVRKESDSKTDADKASSSAVNLEEQMEKIRVFKEEIRKLLQENEKLKMENEELRRRIH